MKTPPQSGHVGVGPGAAGPTEDRGLQPSGGFSGHVSLEGGLAVGQEEQREREPQGGGRGHVCGRALGGVDEDSTASPPSPGGPRAGLTDDCYDVVRKGKQKTRAWVTGPCLEAPVTVTTTARCPRSHRGSDGHVSPVPTVCPGPGPGGPQRTAALIVPPRWPCSFRQGTGRAPRGLRGAGQSQLSGEGFACLKDSFPRFSLMRMCFLINFKAKLDPYVS